MNPITIRPACDGDTDRATGVIARAYAPWRRRLPDLPDVTAGVGEAIAADRVTVATMRRRIVGVLITAVHGERLHVSNLAVSPEAGGQGIGSALLRHADDLARGRGLVGLALATHRDMGGNVAFYERLGWSETGAEGNRVLMQRDLPGT